MISTLNRFRSAVRWAARSLLLDGKGTLSLARVSVVVLECAFLAFYAIATVLLVYVVFADRMVEAAGLAQAIKDPLCVLLGSLQLGPLVMYFVNHKFGSGGPATSDVAPAPPAPGDVVEECV